MFRRKQEIHSITQPMVGWHNGTLSSVQIQRRVGKHINGRYYPSGWDLIDISSNELVAEFNDETAPPTHEWKVGQRLGIAPQDGNELGEMFKEIYRLCYQTTLEAMKLMARALPEHKDSNDGEPIAQIVIGAYSRLPQTIKMTKKEARNATYLF